nr:hypothetical protein [Tanacetum cinerariifolium]
KKQKLDKEVKELKKYLQIVPNDEDDVYTEATPLAHKVPIVDYEIYTENNKPYYKIIRADGSHQLFLCFLSLLRNFDREDLEVLWQLVKERFASSKPKNFSDDFLLTTLIYMFEKPDVQAQVWKNQRSAHGLAKVKSWRLLKSCGLHIITFTTTQMILLVERRYPLTRFTLDQMLNNVRLEVEEESEVSLELLRFIDERVGYTDRLLLDISKGEFSKEALLNDGGSSSAASLSFVLKRKGKSRVKFTRKRAILKRSKMLSLRKGVRSYNVKDGVAKIDAGGLNYESLVSFIRLNEDACDDEPQLATQLSQTSGSSNNDFKDID